MHIIPIKKLTILLYFYLKLYLETPKPAKKVKANLCESIYSIKNLESIEKGPPRFTIKEIS